MSELPASVVPPPVKSESPTGADSSNTISAWSQPQPSRPSKVAILADLNVEPPEADAQDSFQTAVAALLPNTTAPRSEAYDWKSLRLCKAQPHEKALAFCCFDRATKRVEAMLSHAKQSQQERKA
nr:probable UDP-N-acetylglucosamine--peptide N-acetylglucosaminyltransferase SPINDLY isoform X3 [Ipomoea batatas]